MTLWDGLSTSQVKNLILIVGATNRPEDVDLAILRRMPQTFHIELHIGLPVINHMLCLLKIYLKIRRNLFVQNELQRQKILKVILKDESLAEDVDLKEIAGRTVDFSGSDLHELCSCAAMHSLNKKFKQTNNVDDVCISKADFEVAFEKMPVKPLTNIKK